MNNKILFVNFIIIILIFSGVNSVIGLNNFNRSLPKCLLPISGGNILYVGGSGPGNYSNIQDAINAANDSDIIFVYSGTYCTDKNINVNKKLTIIGENQEQTIVKAKKINLKSDCIELTNFSLKGWWESVDELIHITGKYCNISYCTLTPSFEEDLPLKGFEIWGSFTKVKNCDIIDFSSWAVTCIDVNNCYFVNCSVCNSYRGIYTMGSCENIFIINCEIFNCGWDEYMESSGVFTDGSSHVDVISCNIHDNAMGVDIYCSSSIKVIGCDIHDNKLGTIIHDPFYGGSASINNFINNNSYYYNKVGLRIIDRCYDNKIYHNNFIRNYNYNGYDSISNNKWDNGYPSGGNYWDDYSGQDNDGDGIGDTPYNISGGNNMDRYPLMNLLKNIPPTKPIRPLGTVSGNNSVLYQYLCNAIDPNEDQIYYNFSWGDANYSGWIGPYNSSQNVTTFYSWDRSGEYSVKVIAKDDNGFLGKWSDGLSVKIGLPNKPVIRGPTTGKPGVDYEYKIVATDPDGDNVYYYVNWWDWTPIEWIGPYESGEEITLNHTWTEKDQYTIKVKAKDIYDAESDWGTLTVSISKNKANFYNSIMKFLNRFKILKQLIYNLV